MEQEIMKFPYFIGLEGEKKAMRFLKSLDYTNIKRVDTKHDLEAIKNGKLEFFEVKCSTHKIKKITMNRKQYEHLLESNGKLIVIQNKEIKIYETKQIIKCIVFAKLIQIKVSEKAYDFIIQNKSKLIRKFKRNVSMVETVDVLFFKRKKAKS